MITGATPHKLRNFVNSCTPNLRNFFTMGLFNLFKIPRLDKKPVAWDMAFNTVYDADHQVTIDFIDGEPKEIMIDG